MYLLSEMCICRSPTLWVKKHPGDFVAAVGEGKGGMGDRGVHVVTNWTEYGLGTGAGPDVKQKLNTFEKRERNWQPLQIDC